MAVARAEGAWFRLPNKWIVDRGLCAFSAAPTRRGKAGAALKVLIAILARAENQRADSAGANQGSALLSYGELMELTDLSRALIAKGVAMLREKDVVTTKTDQATRKSRYFMRDYGAGDAYGRVPKAKIFGSGSRAQLRTLYGLSVRNEADVNAMKLYLLMCALQDTKQRATFTTYHNIWLAAGIPERKISAAMSVLFDRGLIRRQESPDPSTGKLRIRYDILGLYPT